jgi:hypothetical protein|tara:strand:- start:82 stop:378 length:297 start_codon:yes stop_codon:yes gene_type:complete
MSYTVRLVQSRPNTGVNFFVPTSAQRDKVEEWKTAGKILSYTLESVSADQLTITSTVEFGSAANYAEFIDDAVFQEAANNRIDHNNANSISYSIETPE